MSKIYLFSKIKQNLKENKLNECYSKPELILLNWLSHNIYITFKEERHVTNFDSDIKDGTAIFASILRYWPVAFDQYKSEVILNAKTEQEYKSNAELNIKLIKELGLDFIFLSTTNSQNDGSQMAETLLQYNFLDNLFLIYYLYEILPQLTPINTISFYGPLGKLNEQQILIKNEKKKNTVYKGIIKGSSDFSIKNDIISINANEREAVNLTCQSTISKKQV